MRKEKQSTGLQCKTKSNTAARLNSVSKDPRIPGTVHKNCLTSSQPATLLKGERKQQANNHFIFIYTQMHTKRIRSLILAFTYVIKWSTYARNKYTTTFSFLLGSNIRLLRILRAASMAQEHQTLFNHIICEALLLQRMRIDKSRQCDDLTQTTRALKFKWTKIQIPAFDLVLNTL